MRGKQGVLGVVTAMKLLMRSTTRILSVPAAISNTSLLLKLQYIYDSKKY